MKNILLILAAAIMLTACGGNSRQKTTAGVPDMHNAENALDYQGTYKGVFPAADCRQSRLNSRFTTTTPIR